MAAECLFSNAGACLVCVLVPQTTLTVANASAGASASAAVVTVVAMVTSVLATNGYRLHTCNTGNQS